MFFCVRSQVALISFALFVLTIVTLFMALNSSSEKARFCSVFDSTEH